jgi:hypothetical protein
MAAAATANVWTWVAHCMRLASEYEERAKHEPDPEIRADLLNTVVQFISLADRATTTPPAEDSEDEESTFRRIFHLRQERVRPPPVTRAGAPAPSRKRYVPDAGGGILKSRKGARFAPHPERGLLARCPG